MDEAFRDANGIELPWIVPYEYDVLCDYLDLTQETPAGCRERDDKFIQFVTLQTNRPAPEDSSPTYAFSGLTDIHLNPYILNEPEHWDVPGMTLEFPAGTELVVKGKLEVDGVTFTEALPGQGWGGIEVRGDNGRVDFDGVVVEHADIGLHVRSNNGNIIHNTLFDQNGVGIMADHAIGGTEAPARSQFDLRFSCVTNSEFALQESEGHGIWGRFTNAVILNSTIENNDGYGALFQRADLNTAHGLLATGNGGVATNSRDGLRAGHLADITLASPFTGNGLFLPPDRNSVHDNAEHEISIDLNGFATVGMPCTSNCPVGNRVSEGGFPGDNSFLIQNLADDLIPAQRVYWDATTTELQQFAFADESLVDYANKLNTDPASDAGRPGGCDPASFLTGGSSASAPGSSSFLAATGEQSRGLDGETAAWLRAQIVEMRTALALNPAADTAEALLGRLYNLQRLDRDDELGEHTATMAILAAIRALLLDVLPPSDALRGTAEAALTAGLHDLMRREEYGAAGSIVRLYAPRTDRENTAISLDLTDAALTELSGDDASAVTKYEAIIGRLGSDREQLARDLEAVIALLQRRMGDDDLRMAGGERLVAEAIASIELESRATSGAELGAAYPNPFNPQTVVPFALAGRAEIQIAVFDVLGREVAHLADGTYEAGHHTVIWNGSSMPSGMYLIRMTAQSENEAGTRTFTQRITLLR